MPIESSVTKPADLNASYPANTDAKSQGAQQIRNVKTAIKSKALDFISLADQDVLAQVSDAARLTKINAAIAAAVTAGAKKVQVPSGDYQLAATTPTNLYGIELGTDGRILKAVTGGNQLLNSYGDINQYITGREYMAAFHKLIMAQNAAPTREITALCSGDSTTSGDGTDVGYRIPELLEIMARQRGLQTPYGFVATNAGHSGKHAGHWVRDYVEDDVAEEPDLYILRWGINDPRYYSADIDDGPADDAGQSAAGRRTAADFITSLREGLTIVRAAKDVDEMTVILMSPNSTNDTPNARDELFYESIIGGIKKAARDFQCVFLDTYAMFRDSRSAAGIWQDDPYLDGRAIHPLNVMNIWIADLLGDVVFPRALSEKAGFANFSNTGGNDETPLSTDLPATYPYGLSIKRATSSAWPLDGDVVTFRSASEIVYQTNYSYGITFADVAKFRIGRSADLGGGNGATWGAWVNVGGTTAAMASVASGYTQPGSSENMTSRLSGTAVHINGYLSVTTPGVVPSGTLLATSTHAPTTSIYGPMLTAWDGSTFTSLMGQISSNGQITTRQASPAGTQRIYAYISFDTRA